MSKHRSIKDCMDNLTSRKPENSTIIESTFIFTYVSNTQFKK
jgi:hypothetical protein